MSTRIGERLWQFHGGLKLRDWKRMSTDHPALHDLPVADELVISLSQHIGAPARPVVEVGDRVLKGECLAVGDGFVSAAVHASSSGTVAAIEDRPIPHPAGITAPCIVIRTDGKDEWGAREGVENFETLSPDEVRSRTASAGIVGLGGAVFPSHIKLMRDIHHRVETVILNGAECEPYISTDDMLMRERATPVVSGGRIMRHALEADHCVIAIEDHLTEAGQALRQAVKESGDEGISVVEVPTVYPQGGERQLIETLTGQQVPSGGLPIQIGLVCYNVGTAAAVHDAIIEGIPLISRYVTVTGHGVRNPSNVEALIGTPIAELVEACGGYREETQRLLMGGPMMGFALPTDRLPVLKSTNCVLAMLDREVRETQPEVPCIRCMECVNVCPARLLPQQLYWHARANELEEVEDYGIFDCIECGCCAYVCPSHIPLVDYYREAKTKIWKIEERRQRAERARRRHEHRELRQRRRRDERAERLQRRQEALEERKPRDAIADAVKRSRRRKTRKRDDE